MALRDPKRNEDEKSDLVSLVEKSFGVRFSALIWWFVAVALLAGIAMLFADWDPDKRGGAGFSQQDGRGADRHGAAARVDLKGLNAGKMANFLVHPSPKPLPGVKMVTGGGEMRTLADFRGKVVLLNIWATWCAPCRHEMPSLDRLKSTLGGGGGFDVVALSIDRGGLGKPRRFFDEIGIKNLTLYGDPTGGRIGPVLRVIGMPTTLLIDRQGRELGRLTGPAEWDSQEAMALIRAAMGEKARPEL